MEQKQQREQMYALMHNQHSDPRIRTASAAQNKHTGFMQLARANDRQSCSPGAGAGAGTDAICKRDRLEGALMAEGAVVGASVLSEGPGAGAGAIMGAIDICNRCLEGALIAEGAVIGADVLSDGPGAGAGAIMGAI